MKELKITEMSNSEIKLKMKEYEDEYEVVKNKISVLLEKMKELDNLYDNAKKELFKRKGL